MSVETFPIENGPFISHQLKKLRPDTKNITPNILSLETMDEILHYTKKEERGLDDYFTKEGLLCVNKNCRDNFYAFDKYGIIIRRKAHNDPKNAYGWIFNDDHEPISIHIDQYLMRLEPSKVFKQTIQKLKAKFAKQFAPKSIYDRVSKNLDILFD